ncbi:hypothetical protein OpiT1DRAFT_02554 [Opitutaceae bacterium TAV1]|nr:hypothetical protein OpiT1DRAFT_02554 [Opitutaceae bacterium TAV1]
MKTVSNRPDIRSAGFAILPRAIALLAAPFLALLSLPRLDAALLAYEGFDYTAGCTIVPNQDTSGKGGSGWTGNWAGTTVATVKATDTSVSWTSPDGVIYGGGNGMAISGGNTTRAAYREFSSTLVTTGADLYFSFVLNITGGTAGSNVSGSGGITVSLYDGDFSNESDNGVAIRGDTVGVRVANATYNTKDALTHNTSCLIVVRFSGWNTTTQSYQQTSVWVNPGADDFINTPYGSVVSTAGYASWYVAPVLAEDGVTWTKTGSDGYSGVIIRTSNLDNKVYTLDDLRIGTAWDSVVITPIPEPATCALVIASGMAGILAFFRRRK